MKYDKDGNVLDESKITFDTVFREHCYFKNAPCNYFGKGWYDRCAWCKDNNGFVRLKNNKPY